jgi:cholesterol oxidase
MAAEHFDAVIVGSGFGGSVMAWRLSEAGMRVCILERGRPFPPGSFPRSPHGFGRNWWDPSEGLYGMFQAWSFKGAEAVVSSGLGGGSLIYANVFIRKDEHWFRDDEPDGSYLEWPVTRAELDPHYDRVDKIIGLQRYPFGQTPYSNTPKTLAFKQAAEILQKRGASLEWYLPHLAVTFANHNAAGGLLPAVPGDQIVGELENLHGRQRSTCRLCGECDAGCNYGSKNTLDYTCLSAAWRSRADIRTLCEVRDFKPADSGSGYIVRYVRHDLEHYDGKPRQTYQLPLESVVTDRLILSAGVMGTNFLLLKNRAAFPKLSPRLGERFSTNGDLLTFAAKCQDTAVSPPRPRLIDPSRGPVITSTIRVGDRLDGNGDTGRGFYLQDAGYPEFLNWIIETANAPGMIERAFRFAWRRLRGWWLDNPQTDLSDQIAQVIGSGDLSSGSMPLLGMGRDYPEGRFSLRAGKRSGPYLELDWPDKRSAPYFRAVTQFSKSIADAMGAKHFIQNPDTQYLNRVITVHGLGGCAMARGPEHGVIDNRGRVFNYPGLYVADGSIMPGPVGTNPSFTIAALSDLFAEEIIHDSKFARNG